MDKVSGKIFLARKGFLFFSLSFFFLLSLLLSVFYVFAWVSGKNEEELVYPAGISYLGPEQEKEKKSQDLTALKPEELVLGAGDWLRAGGSVYPYTFLYPEEMKLVSFPSDPLDSWGWEVGEDSAAQNLVVFVETLSSYGFSYSGLDGIKEFINVYPSFYSGLSGVKSISEFINGQGVTGFKVVFINSAGQSPNLDVFFPVPGFADQVLHLGSGKVPKTIFDRIVDSISFKEE